MSRKALHFGRIVSNIRVYLSTYFIFSYPFNANNKIQDKHISPFLSKSNNTVSEAKMGEIVKDDFKQYQYVNLGIMI